LSRMREFERDPTHSFRAPFSPTARVAAAREAAQEDIVRTTTPQVPKTDLRGGS
jgi:hypothetical protein